MAELEVEMSVAKKDLLAVGVTKPLRTDVLMEKKSVHVNLSKDVVLALRRKSFEYNVSVQRILEVLVTAFTSEHRASVKLVEDMVRRVVLGKDGKKVIERRLQKNMRSVNELDRNALYDLIEGNTDDEIR